MECVAREAFGPSERGQGPWVQASSCREFFADIKGQASKDSAPPGFPVVSESTELAAFRTDCSPCGVPWGGGAAAAARRAEGAELPRPRGASGGSCAGPVAPALGA
jgi:hypothetical protein